MSCKPNGKEKENEYEQEKTGAFRVNWLLNKFWYLTEEKKKLWKLFDNVIQSKLTMSKDCMILNKCNWNYLLRCNNVIIRDDKADQSVPFKIATFKLAKSEVRLIESI